jgi:putative peptide zinc metalloprotease protein
VALAALMEAVVAQDPAAGLWERVAGLRFRLRDSVSVDTLNFRGRNWYLLRNAFNRQQFRLSQGVYDLLAQMDGRRTLAQVCAVGSATAPPAAAMQREVLTALTQLQAAGMLTSDAPGDVGSLIAQQRGQRRRKRLARWMRLLSPRLALIDPDRFLTRTYPAVAWLLHPAMLLLWLLAAGLAGLQALMHWPALTLYGAQRLDDPVQWLWLVALYPLVKGLHELGHGFAAKSGGAEVNEMGITLLVFMPVPYVDASAASALASKTRRMLVGGAGIMVEILLAALALWVWLTVDDGLVRDAAFAVMLIGGVSTLLFNGNPLLRFDGYYVLADAIEIPNLATRATRYYGYLARRYLLGVRAEKAPATAAGERRWFVFYGAASVLYRISISIGIALFLVATVPVLGVVLAAWLVAAQLLLPLLRQLHYLLFHPSLNGRRIRALGVTGALLAGVFGALLLAPLPSSTQVDGVVLLPEHAVVRAEVDGFLRHQAIADGSRVAPGEVLFELGNRQLDTDIAALRARMRELEARRDALGFSDRGAREIHAERLAEAREELAELEQRQAGLRVRSPGAGVLQVPFNDDQRGRFVRQGDMLAYLADRAGAVVRVVATQEDASRIRERVDGIKVRLAGRAGTTLPGRLLSEVPLASDRLPSAALGSRAGGAIAVDARDDSGLTTLQRVFAFDIAVPFDRATQYVGSRVLVRFEHAPSPLLPRWYDHARRTLMDEIGL